MNCPNCGYEQVPVGAQDCPSCGTALETATADRRAVEIDVNQRVEQNLGNVIGVKTEAIHGDVYADDVLHVQLYLLSGVGRGESWRRFLSETTPPYRYLTPYTARDRALFQGREKQIRTALLRIAGQPLLTAHGPAGVGKTSLFAAGVIPDLMLNGALVVRVEEYSQPVEQTVRQALAGSSEQIALRFPAERTLPALVQTVVEQTDGTLVLILDHVERLFEPTSANGGGAHLAQELAGALQAVDRDYLRVVVVVDSLDRLGPLPEQLPGLLSHPLPVKPLTGQEAELAIKEPLAELRRRGAATFVSYYGDFVEAELVPHLDRLSPADRDFVHPPHLQIVCHKLYEKAAARHPEPGHIDHDLYSSLGGAEGILFTHVDEALAGFGRQQELARGILEAMAFAQLGPQVTPDQLPLNGATAEQRLAVMDRLVKAQLLHVTTANGRTRYAFSSPVVKERVRKQAPPGVSKRYAPEDDLERAWSAWVVHRRLARRSELHYLASADDFLSPRPEQVLLLLRSALAQDQAVDPWLRRFRDEGGALISKLEESMGAGVRRADTSVDEARRLLGLAKEEDGYELPPPPDPADGFGYVAWSAARHRDPNTRQTAALALTATKEDPRDSLRSLDGPLSASGGPARKWWRRAELLGVLADADPSIARENRNRGPTDRFGIWLWRVRRRTIRQRGRIAALVLGAGFGAGVPLGLFRMLLSFTSRRDAGIRLGANLFWGFVLGAAVGLAIGLAEPLLVGRRESKGGPLRPDRQPALLAVALGTLFFALAHLVVTWFNGVDLREQAGLLATGALFGLGLNLGLYGQPAPGNAKRVGIVILDWGWRVTVAALCAVIAQFAVSVADASWPAATVTRDSGHYRQYFSKLPGLHGLVRSHPHLTSMFDVIVVVTLLLVGITLGLRVAVRRYRRRQELEDRAVD